MKTIPDAELPIGLFDSGVGGFTVLRQLKIALPNEQYLYFGDTRNVPYGDRDPETIHKWALNSISFLLKLRVKAIVVACNISSSVLTEADLKGIPVPAFTLVQFAVPQALRVTKTKRIGVLATSATVKTGSFQNLITAREPEAQVICSACPKLVPLIERGVFDGEEVEKAIRSYLKPILEAGADTVVYGCTHYPLLSSVIEKHLNGAVVVDPAKELARAVKARLSGMNLTRKEKAPPDIFFVSKLNENFLRTAQAFLGIEISGQVQEYVVNK